MQANVAYGSVDWADPEPEYEIPEDLPQQDQLSTDALSVESVAPDEYEQESKTTKTKCHVTLSNTNVLFSVATLTALLIAFLALVISLAHIGSIQQLKYQQDVSAEALEEQLNHLNYNIQNLTSKVQCYKQELTDLRKSILSSLPASSCRDTQAPIMSPDKRSCSCNTSSTWTRVVNIDMTDHSQQCPEGFTQINRTTPPLRTCGRSGPEGCTSATFTVHGVEYSRVCGRIVGYQVGSPEAFNSYIETRQTINGNYLSGISLTHGTSPRQHIWSFICALAEKFPDVNVLCPCNRNTSISIPSFVDQDYFCDTAIRHSSWETAFFYDHDPLWDGRGCGPSSTCCQFNNPPWFCKQLPQPTTDDIELRICDDEPTDTDDIPFEIVELYIN